MSVTSVFYGLGVCVVASPAALLLVYGVTAVCGIRLSESAMMRCTQAAVSCGLVAAVAIVALMLVKGVRHVPIEVGNWVVIPEQHFHFRLKFVFDRLSVPFAIISFMLIGTVGAFTSRYLHRESGYGRFFVCYALFLFGMIVSSLAGTIETLFCGWELVGLSSALLVAFFHERPGPVRNGQRVWSVYRLADAAFLLAAVALHHLTGEGDFDRLMGAGPWPDGVASISSNHATFVGLLLLIAAAGKSALVPFSGWLPRAMEGPTPSSAVFYGALSVHLGAFLLLRVSPLLDQSFTLRMGVVAIGAVSAIVGALSARVQTDIKSAIAFASLTQVGIIVVEIGCGLRYIALVHIIGHACLRTLQLLRAPSLLHDVHVLENAIGSHLPESRTGLWGRMSISMQRKIYRFALERGYLDALLDELIVRPFLATIRWCDKWERRWEACVRGQRRSVTTHDQVGQRGVKEASDA